jgi:hypothetical protein
LHKIKRTAFPFGCLLPELLLGFLRKKIPSLAAVHFSKAAASPLLSKFPLTTLKRPPFGLPLALYLDSGLLAVNKFAGFECQPEGDRSVRENPGYGYRGKVLNFTSALEGSYLV